MSFLCVIGVVDPIRPEVPEAVRVAHNAGIQVIEITGDCLETAKAVATEAGIYRTGDLAVTNDEFEAMTDEKVREATVQAITLAKEQGLLISFDPNLRQPLWKSLDEAKVQIAYGLGQCDVLKISDNEIEFMTDTSDFDEGVQILMDQYPNIRC